MKSFKKFMALSMSLAVLSASTAVTSFAASPEVTIPMTNVVAEGEPGAEIETRTIGSTKFTIIAHVDETYEIILDDEPSGIMTIYKDNSVSFSGKVIHKIKSNSDEGTESTMEDVAFLIAVAVIMNDMTFDTISFSDNVEEITDLVLDGEGFSENLTLNFGKNIKQINPDLVNLPGTTVTVRGFKGTAAETYAAEHNYTFIALDDIPFLPSERYTLGDANDDSIVDASDASTVLAEYSVIQTGGTPTFSAEQKNAADVNGDSVVDSSDASEILRYYADLSTGKNPTWNNN